MGTHLISHHPGLIYAQNNVPKGSIKSLEKVWESPNRLKNPESIVFASKKNIIYLSNVDGNPEDKDNKRFISIISPKNGSIIKLDGYLTYKCSKSY